MCVNFIYFVLTSISILIIINLTDRKSRPSEYYEGDRSMIKSNSKVFRLTGILICLLLVSSLTFGCEKAGDGGSTAAVTSSAAAKTTVSAAKTASTASSAKTSGGITAKATGTGGTALPSSQESQATDSAATATDEIADDESDGLVEQAVDFGGKTVVIATWDQKASFAQPNVSEYEDIKIKIFERAAEKRNIKVEIKEIKPETVFWTEATSAFAAGMFFADIMWNRSNRIFPSLVSEGMNIFYTLDDYLDNSKDEFNTEVATWQGKIYGMVATVPGIIGLQGFYNPEILWREGLPDLFELVKKNEWTWEVMLNTALKATKDIDGDGIIDQWGLGNRYLADALIYSNGISPLLFKDGDAVSGYTERNAINALTFMKDLIHTYKVVDVSSGNLNIWYAGKTAMRFGGFSEIKTDFSKGLEYVKMIPLPIGPNVSGYQNRHASAVTLWTFPIASQYDTKDLVEYWADAIIWTDTSKPEHILFKDLKQMQVDKWVGLGFFTDVDNANFMYDILTIKVMINFAYGIPNFNTTVNNYIYNPIIKGEKSVDTAIFESKDMLDSLIWDAVH